MLIFYKYEKGSTLAEYQIANGEVLARQMFGDHGRKEQGYEGNIRTRGGLMYYQTDDLGNVMDVTDETVEKSRISALLLQVQILTCFRACSVSHFQHALNFRFLNSFESYRRYSNEIQI